ncbi:PREDICTED: thioredoxin-related transmembrane protein 1-like [Priapulus caudatus]|uniref:Thioredoxin-related transmembrane protein 1-like n=1 Tax=Priapulus caudatus TaxID=37621 RepID=A0ABM1EPA7_PRICU|nr:PREDICTED: thioredoxin-related transmembrane protein 1-like [Priapulus caudatus]
MATNASAKLSVFVTCLVILFSVASAAGRAKGALQLTENDWRRMLDGEWMVEFHAPWCPACKSLELTWNDFANWSDDLGINVAQVDVTANPGLSGRFVVTALPTIFHVKEGEFRQYNGARDKDELITYIEEKKWSSVDPLPAWKHPDSIHMGGLGLFFRLSMFLRALHTTLMDEYGLPYWASYLVFAIGTIIVGSILGLLIVCCIDCVFPASKVSTADAKKKKDDDYQSGQKSGSENSATEADDESSSRDSEDAIPDDSKAGGDTSKKDAGSSKAGHTGSSPRKRKTKPKRDE